MKTLVKQNIPFILPTVYCTLAIASLVWALVYGVFTMLNLV